MIQFNPATILSDRDLREYFYEKRHETFQVDLKDGPITLAGGWMFFNIHFWKPLVSRNMPIERRHTIYQGDINETVIRDIQHEIRKDCWDVCPEDETVNDDILRIINHLYNAIERYLGAYVESISLHGLAKLMNTEQMKKATTIDLTQASLVGTNAIEAEIGKMYERIIATLKDPTVPFNVIYPFHKIGLVNNDQLCQVLGARGFVTDIDDSIITKPIMASFLRGMNDIIEYVLETMSVKKSHIYSHFGMPDTQYMNRCQQILASSMMNLHQGDCGTTRLMPYVVNEYNFDKLRGKYFYDPDDTQLTTRQVMTRDVAKQHIDKLIMMRSPVLCNHRDGYCCACGGQMTKYMHKHSIPGLVSSIEFGGPVAQLVLSTKHSSKTNSAPYMIPPPLMNIMGMQYNDVYFVPNTPIKHLKLGVRKENMTRLRQLQYVYDDIINSEQYFSTIASLIILNGETGEITNEIEMADNYGSVPYFSNAALLYIRDNLDRLEFDDTVLWVPLDKFDPDEPIMSCVVANDSMMRFVRTVDSFITTEIGDYTSAVDALRDFSTLAYKKVRTNIIHLETLLRSYTITSHVDYRIPGIEDPTNVRFSTLSDIIANRSIGTQLAFQGFPQYLTNPKTWIVPKVPNLFDNYFGFNQ